MSGCVECEYKVMCGLFLKYRYSFLVRGVAIAAIAVFDAGCSSDFSRFAPTSSEYTGSINQNQIIGKTQPSQSSAPFNEADPVSTGSVQNNGTTTQKIERNLLSPVVKDQGHSSTVSVDKVVTNSVPKAAPLIKAVQMPVAVRTAEVVLTPDISHQTQRIKSPELKKTEPIAPTDRPGFKVVASKPQVTKSVAQKINSVKKQKFVPLETTHVTLVKKEIDPVEKQPEKSAAVKPTVVKPSVVLYKKDDISPSEPDKMQTVAIKPEVQSVQIAQDTQSDDAKTPRSSGISKLRWPVMGRTLISYGQPDGEKTNNGIDISVPNGTPVKAAENGVVIYSGSGLKDFGNTVLVRHYNGLITVYAHNSDLTVKKGQSVKRGQELAKSGMSGDTKVPKLHFEVRKNASPTNPLSYLE
jgi:murein DD-endopeptidase MepM/ murein hydrolase activator NlpD